METEQVSNSERFAKKEEKRLSGKCVREICFVKMANLKVDDHDEYLVEEAREDDDVENVVEESEEVALGGGGLKITDQLLHPKIFPLRRSKSKRRVLPKVKESLTTELCEYEKIRASNIAEREKLLASLGIHSEMNKIKQGLGLAMPVLRREENEVRGERTRVSLRTAEARKARQNPNNFDFSLPNLSIFWTEYDKDNFCIF